MGIQMEIYSDSFGRYLEDFSVGDIFHHEEYYTFTDQDNFMFCHLTHNSHPLHLDTSYANQTRFGRIVVAGTFVFSIVVGLSVPDISGKAIANLEYTNILHHAPVYIGDTINAESKILNIILSRHNKPHGIVVVETKAYNQSDILVISLTRKVLIPRKELLR